MDNPGQYSIAVIDLTAALSAQATSPIANLQGMNSATLDFFFQYGSGGTNCRVVVQTSLDGGNTWLDVARADFGTVTRRVEMNLNASGQSLGPREYSALAAEGINDVMLGDRLRAVITSTGTYANTTLGVNANCR